jgi:AcrR family transcriptional regulator
MPAGRPRKFDEASALDSAIEVFRRHGYEGASLDLLTDAMGINRPSLYGAFGDKAELFDKAVSRYVEGPGSMPLAALDEAGDLESGIAGFFAAVTRNNCTRGRPRGCLIACVLGEAAGAEERWRMRAAELARMTERLLSESVARFVAPSSAPHLARTMATLMYGLAAAAKAGLSQAELQARCDDAVAAALLVAGTEPA